MAVLVVTGCSASVELGGSDIAEAELESVTAERLAESVGSETLPIIDCPGDLEGEVGATMTCELTTEDDPTVLPVFIEVTAVSDGVADFSIEVGE